MFQSLKSGQTQSDSRASNVLDDLSSVQISAISDLLEKASSRGARVALEELGFRDGISRMDWYDMRALLGFMRLVRSTFINTLVRGLTMALLGLIFLGFYFKFGVGR